VIESSTATPWGRTRCRGAPRPDGRLPVLPPRDRPGIDRGRRPQLYHGGNRWVRDIRAVSAPRPLRGSGSPSTSPGQTPRQANRTSSPTRALGPPPSGYWHRRGTGFRPTGSSSSARSPSGSRSSRR
jgi:hypothetical protein